MAQFTLDQLREFGITPDTSLGQNFLVDANILDVIGRLAGLTGEDVVYEPGAGVGILTTYLATIARHVHAIEIDRRLSPALHAALEPLSNVSLHWGDAMVITAQGCEPLPTALVANLPYHVASPIIAETIQHTPSVARFCVMVQREIADRFFAPVSSRSYGALSVVIQLACRRTGTHKVSRSVFLPVPNVDSQLIAFERQSTDVADEELPRLSSFIRAAFMHRRKTLANNLVAAGFDRPAVDDVIASLEVGAVARPQELAPAQFVACAQGLGVIGG